MNDIIYYIFLQKAFINDPSKAYHVLSLVDSPKTFYENREELLKSFSFLSKEDIKRIKDLSLRECVRIYEKCEAKGIKIITADSEDFPKRLSEIFDPPFIIYAFGDRSLLKEEAAVCVVGSRKTDSEGRRAAKEFSYNLALTGAVIVSGVAEGIDSEAIKGALSAGGKTIGVMACSLDVNYPAATREVKKEIISSGGLLISEYPPTMNAYASNFRPRNRIMSALSSCVLAVKSHDKSGTSITALHAAEQGRELYAIPWSIYDKLGEGNSSLIKNGAIPVFSAEEIYLPLKIKYPDKIDIEVFSQKPLNIFPKKEIKNDILSLLEEEELSFDELVIKTKMSASKLSSELINLELEGYTEKNSSGKYFLKI